MTKNYWPCTSALRKNICGHVNAYTGIAYKDEPQVAVVQFLNENAIFWDTGDPRPDSILALLGGRFNAYLADRYGTRAGAG